MAEQDANKMRAVLEKAAGKFKAKIDVLAPIRLPSDDDKKMLAALKQARSQALKMADGLAIGNKPADADIISFYDSIREALEDASTLIRSNGRSHKEDILALVRQIKEDLPFKDETKETNTAKATLQVRINGAEEAIKAHKDAALQRLPGMPQAPGAAQAPQRPGMHSAPGMPQAPGASQAPGTHRPPGAHPHSPPPQNIRSAPYLPPHSPVATAFITLGSMYRPSAAGEKPFIVEHKMVKNHMDEANAIFNKEFRRNRNNVNGVELKKFHDELHKAIDEAVKFRSKDGGIEHNRATQAIERILIIKTEFNKMPGLREDRPSRWKTAVRAIEALHDYHIGRKSVIGDKEPYKDINAHLDRAWEIAKSGIIGKQEKGDGVSDALAKFSHEVKEALNNRNASSGTNSERKLIWQHWQIIQAALGALEDTPHERQQQQKQEQPHPDKKPMAWENVNPTDFGLLPTPALVARNQPEHRTPGGRGTA